MFAAIAGLGEHRKKLLFNITISESASKESVLIILHKFKFSAEYGESISRPVSGIRPS
jgi:hypothetical protein